MYDTLEYHQWSYARRTCTMTWNERFQIMNAILAVQPGRRAELEDLGNYDLIEEASLLNVQHPRVSGVDVVEYKEAA